MTKEDFEELTRRVQYRCPLLFERLQHTDGRLEVETLLEIYEDTRWEKAVELEEAAQRRRAARDE